ARDGVHARGGQATREDRDRAASAAGLVRLPGSPRARRAQFPPPRSGRRRLLRLAGGRARPDRARGAGAQEQAHRRRACPGPREPCPFLTASARRVTVNAFKSRRWAAIRVGTASRPGLETNPDGQHSEDLMARPKITVVGAGNVGATVAQYAVEKELGDVVLGDVIEGIPQGKSLDLAQGGPVHGFDSSRVGTNGYDETADSDVVVITAGMARKPGMTRDDLLFKNAEIVGSVVEQVARRSRNAILILVTNP